MLVLCMLIRNPFSAKTRRKYLNSCLNGNKLNAQFIYQRKRQNHWCETKQLEIYKFLVDVQH